MLKASLRHIIGVIFILTICGVVNLFGISKAWAALAEFGAVTSSGPGKTVFAVSDGSTFARYCLIELTVKGEDKNKKIHWISHPLEKDYVRREPSFIHNFDDKHLLIATSAQKNKDESVAQIHLYNKPNRDLSLLAEATCEFPRSVSITSKEITFDCAKAQKDVVEIGKKKPEEKKFAELLGDRKLNYKNKSYEASYEDWSFEVKETDDYFKDRLQIIEKGTVLKEYKAKDFIRCFEYETIKGSQDKFSS